LILLIPSIKQPDNNSLNLTCFAARKEQVSSNVSCRGREEHD
jgi:hypothetical protein